MMQVLRHAVRPGCHGPRRHGRTALCLALFGVLLTWSGPALAADAVAALPEAPPLDYFIVVTGGELLEGAYPDAHTHFLTRTLRLLGCRCVGSITADDQREAIQRALRFATNQAPLVLVTGGLGPTPNDITRETLSECLGLPLREHPEVLADLERRFGQTRDQLRPNLRRQTLVPERGGYLKNPNGTAVGLVFEPAAAPGKGLAPLIVALPGPPRELQAMVRQELVPYLQARYGLRALGHSLTLRFVGAGQSQIDQTIKDHIAIAPDVIVTSLFEGSRVDFTFALPGHSPEDAARLRRLETNILEHLREYFYADDNSSLEDVVGRRVLARAASLAVAEVGSGGQLAAALGGVKDAARFLAGACAAPSDASLARLLGRPLDPGIPPGAPTAKALAEAAAHWANAPWAVAVGAVETDAAGKRVVWLGVKSADAPPTAFAVPLRDSGEINRPGLVTALLDRLRQTLP